MSPITVGRWYQLKEALDRPAGLYKVVQEAADRVVVANKLGDRFTLSLQLFESSCRAPAQAHSGAHGHNLIPFHEHGMLWALGYKAGRNGLTPGQRRSVLEQVLETPSASLPRINEPEYRSEWGQANSYQRLRKILASLHAFARNQELKAYPSEEAIQDWRTDAAWLQQQYAHLIPSIEDLLRELEDLGGSGQS